MKKGWPLSEPTIIDYPSTIDIPIASGEESAYLEKLSDGLDTLFEKGKADFAIVVGGADAYENDDLPGTQFLKLNKRQMLERDQLVFSRLREQNIPQAWVMAGGYGPKVVSIYHQFLLWALAQT